MFRDWPYLYDGDASYERQYLQTYIKAPRAAVVFAFDGAAVVGASTCLPLSNETANVQQPFWDQGLEVNRYFYFGESVLRRAYRGQGIGVGFFEAREAHAASFGDYTHTAFCAVQREQSDPRRPADAVPLDAFWRKRGYTRQPDMQCRMSWRDIGDTAETDKILVFWTKELRA